MQSPESLSGKDLPLSSPKPSRLQTQERSLESIKGSWKCPPRLTLNQHLLPPPCLVWKYRHERAPGESQLPPWEMAGVRKKEGKSQELQPGSPQPKPQEKPGKQRTCFPPKHKVGTHSWAVTEGGTVEHVQRGHRPGLQLLV